jgi:hypothetical protein
MAFLHDLPFFLPSFLPYILHGLPSFIAFLHDLPS